jgi:uncharacterized protein
MGVKVGSPAFVALSEDLADAGVVLPLAELHGGICGVMCISGLVAAQRWVNDCLEEWQLSESAEVGATLRSLELQAWQMLTAANLAFEPLLPDEDEPLDEQVRALASWCHGFLTGLGFGGLKLMGSADATGLLAEITKDFAEISRAALGSAEAEDLDEAGFALAELKEYVRVSVQLVFEQFGGRQLDARGDNVH